MIKKLLKRKEKNQRYCIVLILAFGLSFSSLYAKSNEYSEKKDINFENNEHFLSSSFEKFKQGIQLKLMDLPLVYLNWKGEKNSNAFLNNNIITEITKSPLNVNTTICDGTIGWNNRFNALQDNTLFAENSAGLTTSAPNSHCLDFSNFRFNIPPNATITGITVNVRRQSNFNGATINDKTIQLLVNGNSSGNNKALATNWSNTVTTITYGNSTDTWGLSLTPEQVNAENFGFRLQAKNNGAGNGRARVLYMDIKINYQLNYPALTIGDRVWKDLNGDGEQDNSEPGIEGVVVNLYDNANMFIASTTTDADGIFTFDSTDGVIANTNYQLRISKSDAVVMNFDTTFFQADYGSILTTDDSDAIDNGTDFIINLTSPNVGNCVASYDFGFVPKIVTDYCNINFPIASGFLDVSSISSTASTGAGTGSFSNLPFPGHGNVTISYEKTGGTHNRSPTAFQTNYTSYFLAQGYPNADAEAFFIEPNQNEITLTYTFSKPEGSFDFLIADLDDIEILYLSAKDENGAPITDFSNWRVRSADQSIFEGSTLGNDSKAPDFDPLTGKITSTDVDLANDHRSFMAFTPDVLVTELELYFPSSGISGMHMYSTLYSTAFSRGTEDCACTNEITTVYANNCSGDDINGYTADWNIGISVDDAPDNTISYQRNAEAVETHTLTGTTDTLTISGIPADGGAYDTLKVWVTNDPTCADTIILKRPVPCPIVPTYCELIPNGNFESGSYPGGGTPTAFAGGTRVGFDDETPTGWTKSTNNGDNFWVESTAAYSGNKYVYTYSAGTTSGGTDACNQISISGLTGNTCYQICVYAADANADGLSSGLAIELQQSSGTFTYENKILPENPAWDDNALTTIPWSQYCYLFTTDPSTTSGTIWISASTEVGTAATSYIVIDDVSMCACGGVEVPSGGLCSTLGDSHISGAVFEDWNYDGVMNQSDTVGVQGVQVTATDCSGNTFTTYTNANGNYQFTGLNQDTTYRIEFTLPDYVSCWAKPTKAGADNGTTVQFVQPGNCANLGVASADDYCQDAPRIITSCYVEGDAPSTDDVLVSVAYSPTGTQDNSFPNLSHEGAHGDIGTTLGLAYQRSSNTVFAASYQKRHTAYGNAGSTGAIYKLSNPTDNSTAGSSVFLDLNMLYGSNITGNNPHPSGSNFSTDDASYPLVGKISLGDLDITPDEKHLWTINLADRQLYKIPLGNDPTNPTPPTTTAQISTYPLYNICDCDGDGSNDTSSDVDIRPFGISIHKGKLYIGLVCSAESTPTDFTKLRAKVFEFDEVIASFTEVLDFQLNYNRGIGYSGATAFPNGIPVGSGYTTSNPANWRPWRNTYTTAATFDWSWYDPSFREGGYPQPILSDIVFDENNNMLLGFRDRFGDMVGDGQNEPSGSTLLESDGTGDILRATPNGSVWSFSVAEATDGTEFFDEDNLGTQHEETAIGGMAILKGKDRVIYSVMDPITNISGGLDWTMPSNGVLERSYQVFRRPSGQAGSSNLFAKANGLGEVELLCKTAPLEIGNYVWEDTDEDGIQDACEPPIQGVVVELVKGGVIIATDTTDANGQYYFSDINAVGGNWVGTGADTALIANTTYVIRISNAEGGSQQMALNGFALTTTDANSNNSNNIDNDASLNGTSAEITVITGDYGCVDHSFDVGFQLISCATIDRLITDRIICSGDLVDTLAVTTTFTNPDSIAFVYFTTPQTDSSMIYSSGIGIDTLQIATANATVRINNINFPTNNGAIAQNYYVYAIKYPTPTEVTCRPYDEIIVTVLPQPDVTTLDANICAGLSLDLDMLVTNVNNTMLVDTAYFTTLQNAIDSTSAIASSLVSPTTTTEYYIRLSTNSSPSCYDIDSLTITVNDIIVTTATTCDDNNTGGNTTDDTFTITVTATNISAGASSKYLVIYNGMILNTGGTAYGATYVASHVDFVADGVFSPTLTIRDADEAGCEALVVVAAVANCSDCPPEICLPIKTIKKMGTGTN